MKTASKSSATTNRLVRRPFAGAIKSNPADTTALCASVSSANLIFAAILSFRTARQALSLLRALKRTLVELPRSISSSFPASTKARVRALVVVSSKITTIKWQVQLRMLLSKQPRFKLLKFWQTRTRTKTSPRTTVTKTIFRLTSRASPTQMLFNRTTTRAF